MKRFCVVVLVTLWVCAFAFGTDLQFPGEGQTIVLASNGANAVGVYWSPSEQREYLFTYNSGTFTSLYQVPGEMAWSGVAPRGSMNSAGAYVGTIQVGPDLSYGFGSMCSNLGCINSIVVDGYQLKGLTHIDVGGVQSSVADNQFNYMTGLSINNAGDILGRFSPAETITLLDPFPDGQFLIHNGEIYFNYTIWDFDNNFNRIALYSEQQFDAADYAPVLEPSSLLLLVTTFSLVGLLAKRRVR